MDYKKLIPSRSLRANILRIFDLVPDQLAIKIQYKIATGRTLDISHPQRFTEKIQWYKLNYRNPLMTDCSDKLKVRKYVSSKGHEDILIPIIKKFKHPCSFDMAELPSRFILKCTTGSHTTLIIKNKENYKKSFLVNKMRSWVHEWKGRLGREWAYYNINPMFFCEELLTPNTNEGIIDYKFFCFNGEPCFLYVIKDRHLPSGPKLGIYDIRYGKLPYFRSDIEPLKENLKMPPNFEYMVEVARNLSCDFPHVRVDLYNIAGKVFFGELTFYSGSGYKGYAPDEFDFILGSKFKLPSNHGIY